MSDKDQFFVFRDNTPIPPEQACGLLKILLRKLGLDINLYGKHSFRIGRTTDLIKYGYTVDEIKRLGRWKSNTIFKYIRTSTQIVVVISVGANRLCLVIVY